MAMGLLVRLVAIATAILLAGCATTPGALLFISNDDGDHELYLYDHGHLQQLTVNSSDDLHATWTADGQRVAYTSNINGNPEIFIFDRATARSTRLTHEPGLDGWPTWSPDGQRIAFISMRDGREQLYAMNADGSDVIALAPTLTASLPLWSPDGESVAFVAATDSGPTLALAPGTGGDARLLSKPADSFFDLSFAPDGKQLLYAARRDKNVDIYRYTLDTGTELRLTQDRWIDAEPAWSPDGKRIAWVSARDDSTRRQLYLMDSDGNNKQRLSTSGNEEMHPHWSPDGSQLAYVAYHQRRFVLHLLDLTTRQTVRLSDNVLAGYQFHPIFDPSGDSVVLDETDAEIVEQKPNRIALSGNGGQQ